MTSVVGGRRRKGHRIFKKEVKVELLRLDSALAQSVPLALLPFVDRVLGPKPNFQKLVKEFDKRFFEERVRAFVVERTKTLKHLFGYACFTKRKIFLQECLFSVGLRRSVLVRILLHEMTHAFLEMKKTPRDENGDHGDAFWRKIEEINGELGCDVMDESDVDWDLLAALGWDIIYACERCGKEVRRSVHRPPDATCCYTWWQRHAARCGGEFVLA